MRLENEKFGDIDSIGVRIPAGLKEKIKNAAKQNKQSMNAEIVRRLEASFEHEQNFNELTNNQKNVVLTMINELRKENRQMFQELTSAFVANKKGA